MNTHSKIDAAATRNPPATTARRSAPAAARSRKHKLLLGAMALLAGTYAIGANTAAEAGPDTILYNFCTANAGCPPGDSIGTDGWQPAAPLMLGSNGKLYGTTELGGVFGKGTVFWRKPVGAGSYSRRYSFGTIANDGAYPQAGLLQYGSLVYGTTYQGGANNFGTVFCMKSAATAEFAHYSFGANATDGTYPQAGLTLVGNWLYGTTAHGGTNGSGTVFRINTKCGQEQVLYNFGSHTPDGAWPAGTLIDVGGTLYGTTQLGGSGCNCGTVFSVTTGGAESVVYSFTGNPDGGAPRNGVVYDSGTGLLFGTTEYGGQSLGTVFSISPACNNSCGSATVYAFKGPTNTPPDGLYPYGNLIDVGGMLYGTTLYGGSGTVCGANGCGTIFQVPATSGPLTETNLHSFSGIPTDGYAPAAGLYYDSTYAELYGTTTSGSSSNNTTCGNTSGCGTVFSYP